MARSPCAEVHRFEGQGMGRSYAKLVDTVPFADKIGGATAAGDQKRRGFGSLGEDVPDDIRQFGQVETGSRRSYRR